MDRLERIFMWLSRLPEPEKLTVRFDEAQQLTIVCSDYYNATRIWSLRHRLSPEISRLNVFVNSDYYASYPVQ
ncbi:MAG: hypothetical protein F6K28_35025 [Microcoleus sp. SIO2G3]|nr:hypothetical protein [Microcoleus sp. SIO2G3]